jgi:succinate dehydrogenase / fumarate reductase iron-sulfur subunit
MTTARPTKPLIEVRVWRGNSHGGDLVAYSMPAIAGEVVLDLVHRIQAGPAPDLAVRWNCKAGKCGSCSAEINGRPGLMCMTRVSSVAGDGHLEIRPLATFPLIRDLVTDVSVNYQLLGSVPALEVGGSGEPWLISSRSIERIQEFHRCIECFLCQDVCHVLRDHPEFLGRYGGPRLFVRLAELEMHPKDRGDRIPAVKDTFLIGLCNVTKCCSEVCPEEIHITDNAIIPLKERVVSRYYDPLARWRRKWRSGRLAPD